MPAHPLARLLFAAAVTLAASANAAPPTYRVTVLPLPQVQGSELYAEVYGINDAGLVVGKFVDLEGAAGRRAVYWTPDHVMHEIGELPGLPNCEALAVNDLGQIVGSCTTLAGPRQRAFIFDEQRGIRPLGTTKPKLDGDFYPAAINNSGVVVGHGNRPYPGGTDLVTHALIWYGSGEVVDPVPDSRGGYAYAINAAGDWTASQYDLSTFQIETHGFFIKASRPDKLKARDIGFIDLGRPREKTTVIPHGLNNLGQVVGSNKALKDSRSFLWDAKGGMRDLGTLSPTGVDEYDFAGHINDQGVVIGHSARRPYYHDAQNGMVALLGLIDPADPVLPLISSLSLWDLESRVSGGINNKGQIALTGYIQTAEGLRRMPLLLTPQ